MAALALPAQHRSPGTDPQIPFRFSVSQFTTEVSPRGPGRSVTARGLIPGSEIPLPAPHAGLLPTGSAGILGAGRGRPSLEPRFNPNSPGTNFSPLSHFFFSPPLFN